MKTVQTPFILSSASVTHCFWLIADCFAQIWAGALWTSCVHPAVCSHGLPWTQGTVAGLGELVRTGLVAARWQSYTFHTLWAPAQVSQSLKAPSVPWASLGVSSWASPRQTQPLREVLQITEPAPSSQLELDVRHEGCEHLLQSLR